MSGYYAFKAYYYKISEVTMYLNHKWHTRKQKLQINGWVLNVLHILGQQVVCQKGKPQIDGSFLNSLHIKGEENSSDGKGRVPKKTANYPDFVNKHFIPPPLIRGA